MCLPDQSKIREQISTHNPSGMGILILNRPELSDVHLKMKTSWTDGENMCVKGEV